MRGARVSRQKKARSTLLVLITDRERLPAQSREEKHHVLYHVVECQVRRVHRDALVLAVEVYLTKDRKWFSVNRAALSE